MALRQETSKLKEVADVARNQIENLEHRKHSENLELEALRQQVLDLQTQSEDKALVGKLHRQIIALQARIRIMIKII